MISLEAPVNFLRHVYSSDIPSLAKIVVAQGEDDYKTIIEALEGVKEVVEKWIGELEDESRHRGFVQGDVVEEKK